MNINRIKKISIEIIKKINRHSCAKLTKNNVNLNYNKNGINDCRYDRINKINLINISIDNPEEDCLRTLVHELRHAQQNILYYEFYLKNKHIKDIHNDVLEWKKVFENPDTYDELYCSIEYDANAYIYFFFNMYVEYNICCLNKNPGIDEIKQIYLYMKKNNK